MNARILAWLELRFWQAAVAVLRLARPLQKGLAPIVRDGSPRRMVLGGLLGVSVLGALFVGQLTRAQAAPTGADQSQVLIALVDDLSSPTPRLMGLWQVAQDGISFQLTPLYPLPLVDNPSIYAQPHSPVLLEGAQLATADVFVALSGQNSWDRVFWLDVTAYQQLNSNLPALPASWEQPQAALRQQVEALNLLCHGSLAGLPLDTLLALMPQHLRSTQSTFELITGWDQWSEQSQPAACQHTWVG